MDKSKAKRLAAAGWKVGSAKELLQLTDEEEAIIEMKIALADGLKKLRAGNGLTQIELAKRLRSSQSRVAKLEAADASVSIDLLIRAWLAAGGTRQQMARTLMRKRGPSAA